MSELLNAGMLQADLALRIEQLQQQNAELNLIKGRYEQLIFAVENKHPDESRHETALRYIRQAESRGHQPCGDGKSEQEKVIEDAIEHGIGVMSVGLGVTKHIPHDEVFNRQHQTNGSDEK